MPNIGAYPINSWPWNGTYAVPETAYFNAVLDLVDETDDGTLTEPVTLSEAKLFSRITTTTEDALITALIKTARRMVEKFLNINVIARDITVNIDNPLGNQFLPYGPVNGDIVLKDSEGTTIDSANIKLGGTTFPRLIYPQACNLSATYNAGYSACPEEIKTAIKMQVTFLYRRRGDGDVITRNVGVVELGLSPEAKAILKPLKRGY